MQSSARHRNTSRRRSARPQEVYERQVVCHAGYLMPGVPKSPPSATLGRTPNLVPMVAVSHPPPILTGAVPGVPAGGVLGSGLFLQSRPPTVGGGIQPRTSLFLNTNPPKVFLPRRCPPPPPPTSGTPCPICAFMTAQLVSDRQPPHPHFFSSLPQIVLSRASHTQACQEPVPIPSHRR